MQIQRSVEESRAGTSAAEFVKGVDARLDDVFVYSQSEVVVTDVRDLARALVLLMNTARSGSIYNACCGRIHCIRDLVELMERTARAIRKIDPDATIIVESMYGDPGWFRSLSAIDLDNVIYSVHCYYPHDFTHQGIYETNAPAYKWPDESRGWNRDFIRRHLQPVVDFQREHIGTRILVGEFSAVAWAEGADQYLRDSIAVFEELGFDWIYHEYRGWSGWNVELEAEGRGKEAKFSRPSEDTPRKRALLDGLARWKLDNAPDGK